MAAKKAQKKAQVIPLVVDSEHIVPLKLNQLLFDPENPRIAKHAEGQTELDLIKTLWSEMAVDEVAFSIAENGYFKSEPLFVIPKSPEEQDGDQKKYIVLEGNRRLAAVRLLTDEALRKKVKADELPEITEERKAQLAELPALVYKDREELWTAIGFRHINGIKPWDSFSKAKYIAQVHEEYDVPLDEIAEKIGDRHATVKRLYRGYKVLEQAEATGTYSAEDRQRSKFYFSHLYTAVDQNEFQHFLGLNPENLKPEPVPKRKLKELGELMTYLYGRKSEDKKPLVVTQNPDLNTLREVVGSPAALAALRKGYPLAEAHNVAVGDARRFRDALTTVKVELQNAKATVTTGYGGEADLFRTIQDVIRVAESLRSEMDSIRTQNRPSR